MLKLEGGSPPPRRGGAARALGFTRPWLFGAASAVYLFGAGWWKWKNRAAIVELCRHFGYNYDTQEPNELPSVAASALTPASSLLDVREIDAVDGNVSERELVTICRLVRAAAPHTLFELGTFDGRTTLNLAANSPPDARVLTLDLPREAIVDSASPIHAHEVRYADKRESGSRYKGSDVAGKIEQLYGDSGTFDFSPYYNAVDFVFVDASHTYEYVINDSLHAIQMLRNGAGTILWHDYSRWDGVTRALNELKRIDPRFAALQWIEGTTLGYLKL
ncbi:MAG TPA: class I SAM-dependent methyltransferase [Gemmatimonadaceae bacterium]|nr:class I SAM-dependent methyltransferase [Gemmatimonadaceae bacterium]